MVAGIYGRRFDFVSFSLTDGGCEKAKNTTTGVHVMINMLSTALVATSSYCCQLLMAPTRQDVDEAPARRIWLSVGSFNIKNWILLHRRRKILWVLMFGTSIVIQLIYNSAVYSSTSANDSSVVSVPLQFANASYPDSQFSTGDCFEYYVGHNASSLRQSMLADLFETLAGNDCINIYAGTPLVASCLAERISEHCRVFVNIPIRLVVIACNLVKVVCMFITTHEDRSDVFNTIGDVIASFLKRPDPTTANECMLDRDTRRLPDWPIYIWKSVHLRPQPTQPIPKLPPPIHPTQPLTQPRHWASAAKLSLRLIAGYLTPLCFGPIVDSNRMSLSSIGPGLINTSATLTGLSNSFVGMVLLVNTVQLLVTGLYFLYNNMLTRMLLPVEYNDFAIEQKPLRVSFPKAEQRSTIYLIIPYRYSAPMLLAFTIVHWLVSERLFFVQVLPYNVHGKPVILNKCGYSAMALLIAELIIITAAAIITGLSFRKFKAPMMPLAFNCSAAISAACHPPPDDQDAPYHPVMWGEVQINPADTVEYIPYRHGIFISKALFLQS
ncbi:hypothetical protein MW887_005726 [Aspergillus wentii]|nr:hypothetical protein MW887_005726 [Aspergillus wentii]